MGRVHTLNASSESNGHVPYAVARPTSARAHRICVMLSGPFIAAVAILVLGSGCSGMNAWRSKPEFTKFGDGVPSAPLSSAVTGANRNDVVQASATMPAASTPTPSTPSTFAKMTGMAGKLEKKPLATEMVLLWRNKIDYLPDPTRNGAMGAGLAGQVFLFDPKMQFVLAEGKLTVALYDETARPPGQAACEPQVWEFTKETLKGLRTPDERWGMGYALFLPWPGYRADVTRVRIAARFEAELGQGGTLYARESQITLDTGAPGTNGGSWSNQPVPSAQSQPAGFNPLGGPPPENGPGLGVLTQGQPTQPAPPMGALQSAPPNYGSLAPAGPAPVPTAPASLPVDVSKLPPIAFTAPRRQ